MLTGDLNELRTTYLETQFGLHQSTKMPIHNNNNILDALLTNRLTLFRIQVEQSLIKMKHNCMSCILTSD